MGDTRRGFLKAIGLGAVSSWITTRSETAEAKVLSKDRPNCILAEVDEVWTLEDGFKLPVRRIEMKLDFEPAITWEIWATPEQMVSWGLITSVEHYPKGNNMLGTIRRVFPRLTERELRIDYALQKKGHHPVATAGQITSDDAEYNRLRDEEQAEIVAKVDNSTPFEKVLRSRMTNAWLGYRPHMVEIYEDVEDWPPPLGVFAEIQTPTVTQYALGVSEFEVTSACMLVQVPAKALFGT